MTYRWWLARATLDADPCPLVLSPGLPVVRRDRFARHWARTCASALVSIPYLMSTRSDPCGRRCATAVRVLTLRSMAPRGVDCRRPPLLFTRVISVLCRASSQRSTRWVAFSPSRAGLSTPGVDPRAAGDLFVAACVLSRNDAQVSKDCPGGQLGVLGGASAHPDELPRRVMTTHPTAVDAGTRVGREGPVEARKYRTCGHRCVRRGSALEGTRPNAGPTVQLAAHVQRQNEDDATTGAAASRRSRIWSSRSSRGCVIEQGRTPLPHRSPAAGPGLTRAGDSQHRCVPILFAMAGA
jgi:hypothetical protein